MKSPVESQMAKTTSQAKTQLLTIRQQPLVDLVLYQARLIYFWAYPVILVVTIGTTLLLIRQYQPEARGSFYTIFEVLFPLASSFLFVPLILREKQQRTLALVSVTQCSLPLVFLVRLTLITSFLAILVVILGLLLALSPPTPDWMLPPPDIELERDLAVWPISLAGGPNGIVAILLTILAPTFFLAGIGCVSAHWTTDARVGYLVIFVLWVLNRSFGFTLDTHPLWHSFYLFVRSTGTGDWLLPKLTQLSSGFGLLILAWLLLYKQERLLRE